MVQFFMMVLNGFSLLFDFFSKYTAFLNSSAVLSNLRLFTRKLFYVGMIALFIAYIALLLAFFYFMIDSLVTAYNMIATLIHKIQTMEDGGGQASPMIQGAMYFINVSGIANGISVVYPFLASALTFRLIQALYKVILFVHGKFLDFYSRVVDGITAA